MAEEGTELETLRAQVESLSSKLQEFRGTNAKLIAEVEKFGGISPEDAAEAQDLKRQRERKELVDAKDIDAALDAQESKLKEEYERRIAAQDERIGTLSGNLRKLAVTNVLKTHAIEAGARPEAVEDLVESIEAQFTTTETGELVRMVNGSPALSQSLAGKNEPAAEFFESFAKLKPFYFHGSGGGGDHEQHRKTGGGVRKISREQMQTGEYAEQIIKGEVVVDGYESDVTSASMQ